MASKRKRKAELPPVAKLPVEDCTDMPFHPPPEPK